MSVRRKLAAVLTVAALAAGTTPAVSRADVDGRELAGRIGETAAHQAVDDVLIGAHLNFAVAYFLGGVLWDYLEYRAEHAREDAAPSAPPAPSVD